MNETIGNRAGVYRTTMRREAFRLPILLALATVLVVVLTQHRVDTANMDLSDRVTGPLVAFAAGCCLVGGSLWLHTWIWKVTLFEGGVRGPTYSLGLRTLAWAEISSAERIPLHLQSINPYHAVLQLHPSTGPESGSTNRSPACRSSRSMFGASPGKITHFPASSTNAERRPSFSAPLARGPTRR